MNILSPIEARELLFKAKYIKRWRGPDGKWRYQYGRPSERKPRASEIAETKTSTRTGSKVTSKERKMIHDAVTDAVTESYYKEIPIEEIDTELRKRGFLLVQEDGTPWAGMLVGREGRTIMEIGRKNDFEVRNGVKMHTILEDVGVALSWYKDDKRRDSKYDVVAYGT